MSIHSNINRENLARNLLSVSPDKFTIEGVAYLLMCYCEAQLRNPDLCDSAKALYDDKCAFFKSRCKSITMEF